MYQVSLVKSEVRTQQWRQIILECQSSGMTVKAWCAQNGINIKSYYYRIRKLRKQLCSPQHAVSVCSFAPSSSVIIRNGSVTAEIPDGMSESTINAVVKAVTLYPADILCK